MNNVLISSKGDDNIWKIFPLFQEMGGVHSRKRVGIPINSRITHLGGAYTASSSTIEVEMA